MARIVYLVFGTQDPRGGHKMAVRHVEALHHLGYDAVAWVPAGPSSLAWLAHRAPIEPMGELAADDVLVIPEDAINGLRHFAGHPQRKVVFCQNHFHAAERGAALWSWSESGTYADYMACSGTVASWLRRFLPRASVEVVPAFADERLFKPGTKALSIAFAPSKRQAEYRAISFMVTRLFTGRSRWRWAPIQGLSEGAVAGLLGEATLFLSLGRFEGLGLMTLEAMASGCLPVGFTGFGGREYASPVNGLWVEEDDCDACAEALARAMLLVEANPGLARQMTEAARRAAMSHSHAIFVRALDEFWRSRISKVSAGRAMTTTGSPEAVSSH